MQTFLTSYSFVNSAQSLDSKRLNKQVLEAIQLYELCTNRLYLSKGFAKPYLNHPACKWWKNQPESLAYYIFCHVNELYNRFGKANKLWEVSIQIADELNYELFTGVPQFLNNEIVESHKSALVYKTECNFYLYEFCYYYQIPLNRINENTCEDFVYYLLRGSNIKEFSTMRWSESNKIPKGSNVLTAYENYRWYYNQFPLFHDHAA